MTDEIILDLNYMAELSRKFSDYTEITISPEKLEFFMELQIQDDGIITTNANKVRKAFATANKFLYKDVMYNRLEIFNTPYADRDLVDFNITHDLVIALSDPNEVIRKFPHQIKRVEDGPIQFGNDWPGIFIRGDHAMNFALQLENLLFEIDEDEDNDPIRRVVIIGLIETLKKCKNEIS